MAAELLILSNNYFIVQTNQFFHILSLYAQTQQIQNLILLKVI